jgi:hypothetical protein
VSASPSPIDYQGPITHIDVRDGLVYGVTWLTEN